MSLSVPFATSLPSGESKGSRTNEELEDLRRAKSASKKKREAKRASSAAATEDRSAYSEYSRKGEHRLKPPNEQTANEQLMYMLERRTSALRAALNRELHYTANSDLVVEQIQALEQELSDFPIGSTGIDVYSILQNLRRELHEKKQMLSARDQTIQRYRVRMATDRRGKREDVARTREDSAVSGLQSQVQAPQTTPLTQSSMELASQLELKDKEIQKLQKQVKEYEEENSRQKKLIETLKLDGRTRVDNDDRWKAKEKEWARYTKIKEKMGG